MGILKNKTRAFIFLSLCLCMFLALFGVRSLQEAAAQEITYDSATVYDLYDISGEMDFTSGAEKNRNIGQLPATHNVAVRAKLSYDATSKKVLIINFLMGHKETVNTQYYLQDCGYMFYFRDNTARLVYQGDGTETNQLINSPVSLGWAELSAKLGEIDNLDGSGKINAEEWRYGREPFLFEMGYVKAYTDGEWTGNYVYVKINDVELMSFTDTGAYYKDKGDYVGKGATGYDYTYYTLSTAYETLPGVETLENIRTVKTAISQLPEAADIAWTDKEKVESVRQMYDALTNDEKSYIKDISRLVDAETMIWFLRGDAAPSAVTVYDLFDVNGDVCNTYTTETGIGRKVGYTLASSDIAFKTKVTFDVYDKEVYSPLYFDLFILQKKTTSGASDYGYLCRWKDNKIQILYDANPLVDGEGDNTVGASVSMKTPDLSVTESFTVEFGCAKYIAYGEWYANYVYVKIDDTEVVHFIDSGDYFKDKGKIITNGIYGGWNSYTFNSLYDFAEITMGDVPEGAKFEQGEMRIVPMNVGYKMPISTKDGYCISSAKINGTDVTDGIVLTEDGYALDCSVVTEGGVLTLETSKKQVDVRVTPNETVTIELAEKADIRSLMDAKIATKVGHVLTSFKMNGVEYIDEVQLGKNGYYYCSTYRFTEDVTITTETEEKTYSIVVYCNQGGQATCVENVGAFGQVVVNVIPDEDYLIASILLNGEAVSVSSDGKVVIDRATQNMQFDIRFAQRPVAVDTSIVTTSGCSSMSGGVSSVWGVMAVISFASWIVWIRKNKKVKR